MPFQIIIIAMILIYLGSIVMSCYHHNIRAIILAIMASLIIPWIYISWYHNEQNKLAYKITDIITIKNQVQIILDSDKIVNITNILGRFIDMDHEVLIIVDYPKYSYGIMWLRGREYKIISVYNYEEGKF